MIFLLERIRHAVVILIATGFILTPSATAAFRYLAEGMEVPELSGNDIINGNKISVKDLSKENLVIVVFWSTWSPRSLKQLEDMKTLLKKYRDSDIEVVGVNVDGAKLSSDEIKHVTETVKRLGITFPVLIDKGLVNFNAYGVIAVPSTAVVDTSGRLRFGPASYSLTTRDRIVDSINVFLGLKDESERIEKRFIYEPKKRAGRFYRMALNLYMQRIYERALANLDSAEVSDSLFAAPFSLRGEVYLKLEKYEKGALEFARAVELDSLFVQAWAGWGKSLFLSGKVAISAEKLSRAIQIDSTYFPAYLDLSLCKEELGDFESALILIQRAEELNKGSSLVYYYSGIFHRKAGSTEKAIESLLTGLEILYPDR